MHQQHELTVIRTDYTSRDDLTICVDGFLKKAQVVAVSVIGERLSALGFAGMGALLMETRESRHYRFHTKDDDAEGASAPCPWCGRLMPPPWRCRVFPRIS